MATLLNIALINAVTVLPLAVLAIGVSRFARRPALTHALWVLVLLKFITPPLFHLPVTIEVPVADVGHVSNVPALPTDREPPKHSQDVTALLSHAAEVVPSDLSPVAKVERRVVRQEPPSVFASTLKTCSTYWAKRPDVRSMLLIGWLAGTALWMSWQLTRAVRFRRRVLRGAVCSSELQDQTGQLAAALGLRRVPRVLIVDAAVSPMLWGCGSRAKLLFPADLRSGWMTMLARHC